MNAALLAGALRAQARLDVVSTAGLAGLYDLTRANLLNYSEGPITSLVTRGGSPAPVAAGPSDGFSDWISFPGVISASQYVYAPCVIQPTVWQMYTFSAFVRMDDGGVPVPGPSNGTAAFSIIIAGAVAANPTVTDLGGGLYRVSGSNVLPPSGALPNNNGILKYLGQNARSFKVTGYMLNAGPVALPYEKTGDPQVVYDRVTLRNIIPSTTLSDAIWVKQASTVQAATLVSGQLMFKLVDSATDAVHQTYAAQPYTSGKYRVSIDVATGDYERLSLYTQVSPGSGTLGYCTFRLSTGTATIATTTAAVTITNPRMINKGNGLYRVSMDVEIAAGLPGATQVLTVIRLLDNAGLPQFVGDGTKGLFLANPQFSAILDDVFEYPANNGILGATASAEATDPLITPAGLVFDGVDDKVVGPVLPAVSESGMTYIVVMTTTQQGVAVSLLDNKTQGSNNAGMTLEVAGAGDGVARLANGSTQIQARGGLGRAITGKPVLLVGVADRVNGQLRFYLGMELLATTTLNPAWNFTSAQPLIFGNYGAGAAFAGTIHYAAVYNRALSNREVVGAYRTLRKRLAARDITLS